MLAARFKRHRTTVTHSAARVAVPSITPSFACCSFPSSPFAPSPPLLPPHLRSHSLLLPPPSPWGPVPPFLTSPPHNCAPVPIDVLCADVYSCLCRCALAARPRLADPQRLASLQTSVMRSRRYTRPPNARDLPSSSLHSTIFLNSSSHPAPPAPYTSPLPPLFSLHSSPYAAGHTTPHHHSSPPLPPLALLGMSSIYPHTYL
ncbi:hypothetical protein B0H14DRAFT_3443644 [Mycena olivaceomarginata]|nr:hypothetical protein B0H14DRAFT_3443644 [Mycena olivaceomarginata]